MKKVSVIIDNFNYEQFLREAVDSVLNQTYENYEVIIVDDGSSDGSKEIIEEYAKINSCITPVFKKNGGQMSAFNCAYKYVTGDIVAFLDSDDYWYPEKLEKVVDKHKQYQLVQHYLSNNGQGIYRKVNTDVDWHSVLVTYGYLYNHSVCSSLSFDRELLDRFFPFSDEGEMIYCADGILFMAALSIAEVGFVEEELGFYRIHGNNGYVGATDKGEKARRILKAQHLYVNRQLESRGMKKIPFDNYHYFSHLIGALISKGVMNGDERVIVYGTESSGLYMTKVLKEKGFRVIGYIDSNPGKWGMRFEGEEVLQPEEASEAVNKDSGFADFIIIASSAQEAISLTLSGLGLKENKDYFRLPI